MEPRLKSSKKWTPYPKELTEQIREVVEVFFADYETNNGKFIIEGEIYPEEVLLRIGINRPGQLRQDNFEASLQYDVKQDKAIDLVHIMTDFLGEAWINFLEDEPELSELPLIWQENIFEKRKIYLRYTSANTELEAEANRLLAIEEKKLVYGEDSPDEELLDLDGEELSFDDEFGTDNLHSQSESKSDKNSRDDLH